MWFDLKQTRGNLQHVLLICLQNKNKKTNACTKILSWLGLSPVWSLLVRSLAALPPAWPPRPLCINMAHQWCGSGGTDLIRPFVGLMDHLADTFIGLAWLFGVPSGSVAFHGPRPSTGQWTCLITGVNH